MNSTIRFYFILFLFFFFKKNYTQYHRVGQIEIQMVTALVLQLVQACVLFTVNEAELEHQVCLCACMCVCVCVCKINKAEKRVIPIFSLSLIFIFSLFSP